MLKKNDQLLNLMFLFFLFFVPISHTRSHKPKWCVLFFTRIKLVARVLACARANARIKWRRLIPTKLIKENFDIFGDFIFGNYNNCVFYSIFPNSLKNVIITPIHKKGVKTSKDNYRLVSILSNIFLKYKKNNV